METAIVVAVGLALGLTGVAVPLLLSRELGDVPTWTIAVAPFVGIAGGTIARRMLARRRMQRLANARGRRELGL